MLPTALSSIIPMGYCNKNNLALPNTEGHIAKCLQQVAGKYDAYHTPGHKGRLCAYDVTELGVGQGIFPADCIERAQQDSARMYGVQNMRYLVNGSSIGIKAALWCFRGQKVLVASGAHRSFYEGCELAGVQVVSIDGKTEHGLEYTRGCAYLPPPLTLQQAERAIDTHPDASALFLTSPDCLGRVADIKIAQLCKERGVALLVDGAHGAHFAFAPDLRQYRFETVADVTNLSAHKTLGAFTQTALLAVNRKYIAQTDHALALLGTTSPNYVLLAGIEESVLYAAKSGKEYERLRAFSADLRKEIDMLPNTDYTRLCIKAKTGSAHDLFAALNQKGIMPEAVVSDCVVCILTPYDSDGKLQRLQKALRESV